MSKKLTKEQFIEKANITHNNIYDYSKSIYINDNTKLNIICNKHGEFKQIPNSHYKSGCPKCGLLKRANSRKLNIDELLNKFNNKHNYKFDYSKVNYTKKQNKVIIICKKHNEEYLQTPEKHLESKTGGCPKCNSIGKGNLTLEKFLQKAFNKHKNKYNYSLTKIINCTNKIKIICNDHGEFEQIPNSHLRGRGCPNCHKSNGNNEIKNILEERKIKYIQEKKFDGCKNKKHLPFDFYLPKYNTCIEFDGLQHFKPIKLFGGIEEFEKRIKNDLIKNNFCLTNNIFLVRIPYYDFDNIEKIIKDLCQ